jgi:hypothetical protein
MWAYDVEAGFLQKWPLPENFIYTNETYKAAGMGGFPLGDFITGGIRPFGKEPPITIRHG